MQQELSLLDKDAAEKQLLEEQKTIRYDTKEFTVEIMVSKLANTDLEIPDYQRKFVWDDFRRSKFIESVLLGIPIPFMFGFDLEQTGKVEIIDGAQRIKTLSAFINDEHTLEDLDKLDALNGFKFSDLPVSQQRRFKNRTIRMIVLYEATDFYTRFEIFERINTTPLNLRAGEIRRGAFPGLFYELVEQCSTDELFRTLCPLTKLQLDRAEAEEMVLRFFAYGDRYKHFVHDVRKFLDQYLVDMNEQASRNSSLIDGYRDRFTGMLKFVRQHFPNGFGKTKTSKTTPRVRFEAISVGTYLALQIRPDAALRDTTFLASTEFQNHTRTDASNSGPKLTGRIEYVRDQILSQS